MYYQPRRGLCQKRRPAQKRFPVAPWTRLTVAHPEEVEVYHVISEVRGPNKELSFSHSGWRPDH